MPRILSRCNIPRAKFGKPGLQGRVNDRALLGDFIFWASRATYSCERLPLIENLAGAAIGWNFARLESTR